jgi:hypothetical protein
VTAWLGREDSNLRMVESKSAYSTNESNGHSEKIAKFGINRLNGLAVGSE